MEELIRLGEEVLRRRRRRRVDGPALVWMALGVFALFALHLLAGR